MVHGWIGLVMSLAVWLGMFPVGAVGLAGEVRELIRQDLKILLEEGKRQWQQSLLPEAMASFRKALALARRERDRKGEGQATHGVGIVLSLQGHPRKSLKSFQQALLIRREVKDHRGEAETLLSIGNVYADLGQAKQALKIYQQAHLIFHEIKDRRGQGNTLNNIAVLQSDLGKPDEALKTYQESLLIHREVKDRRSEGFNLLGIGNLQSDLGYPEEALTTLGHALLIRREMEDRRGEGATLNIIANVKSELGQLQEALKTYQQALLIRLEVGDRRGEGATLNNIGRVQRDLGQLSESLKSYQMALLLRHVVQDPQGTGETLLGIGNVQSDMNQSENALKSYLKALQILREVKDRRGEGNTLHNIARAQSDLRQHDKALMSYQQALLIRREMRDRRGESLTLSNMAMLQRDRGQTSLAISNLEQALTIQLEIRRGLQRKDRQTFLNQSQSTVSTLVNLLITMQRPVEAFRWQNLFSTADLADYGRIINAQVSDPEIQRALSDWRHMQASVQAQRQRLEREPNEPQLQGLVDKEAAQNRAAEALINRYPMIAELLETRPADLERLQAGIPADTVVLQPVLLVGVPKRPDSVALFVLTRTSLDVVTVPLPAKFTSLVEAYREELEHGDPIAENSQQLYDLLIGPVEAKGLLPAGSRLALISTGALHGIPLETLIDRNSGQYLIEKIPIHYLTRLSRTGPAGTGSRPAPGSGSRRALVMANPKPNAKPIPGTETEANFLLRAFPGSLVLRGEQATLARFEQQANRYPLLHLGTHGCFLPSGCSDPAMAANTLLFANGVQYPISKAAELRLSNTELLVLSACQTARITNDSDVGVSGLAYVWERAGAKAVVATLWNAYDQTSSQLIPAFYTNLRAGMDKAEAMRQAKLKLIRSDPDLSPSKWAPFIVIGDVAPLGQ